MKLANLFEMAVPSQTHKEKTYFHGTQSESAVKNIIKNGLKPREIEVKSRSTYNLTPVEGKVYFTPNIAYAQIYALGGDLAGTGYKAKEKYGYIFSINGNELKDIQPDEDSVGEIIHNYFAKEKTDSFMNRMLALTKSILTANQFLKLKDGDYITFAQTGKKLLPKLSDGDKLRFLDLGAHVAHTGNVKIEGAWRVDLKRIKDLKSDGSNFFEIAVKIYPK